MCVRMYVCTLLCYVFLGSFWLPEQRQVWDRLGGVGSSRVLPGDGQRLHIGQEAVQTSTGCQSTHPEENGRHAYGGTCGSAVNGSNNLHTQQSEACLML